MVRDVGPATCSPQQFFFWPLAFKNVSGVFYLIIKYQLVISIFFHA